MRPYVFQCKGKAQCESRSAAARALSRAAKFIKKKSQDAGKSRSLSLYKCPHCGWWHIGHRPKYRE